jgi:hypothetical protein
LLQQLQSLRKEAQCEQEHRRKEAQCEQEQQRKEARLLSLQLSLPLEEALHQLI